MINDCSYIFFLEIALGSILSLEHRCVFFFFFPVIRSWDCTTNIFLHRLWSATLSNALCRLVRMEPPMPSAWDHLLGTISVISVLCVFTVFTSMSSLHAVMFIRNIRMHIYIVTNLLMLFFWIKLIMKLPKFLTVVLMK